MADNSYLAIISEDEQFHSPLAKSNYAIELLKEKNIWIMR